MRGRTIITLGRRVRLVVRGGGVIRELGTGS
jgi:hypothetical protein